jgi:3-isopropylmalate/(R)-2-methylmalate dehydratase small subunit
MVPIALPVDEIMKRAQEIDGYRLTVDLETQMITDESGLSVEFVVGDFQRYCLLEGLDDIGLTLRHEEAIKAFEASR